MSEDANIDVSKASSMLRRLLNIASIFCLVLCMALMGMWAITNYRCLEVAGHLPFRQIIHISTMPGRVCVGWVTWQGTDRTPSDVSPWSITWHPPDFFYVHRRPNNPPGLIEGLGFVAIHNNVYGWVVRSPFWFLVLASGLLAMAFQVRWPVRFTLRRLFIVTTFLAVALGMFAWLDRPWIGK
jgi:hypothetical protein